MHTFCFAKPENQHQNKHSRYSYVTNRCQHNSKKEMNWKTQIPMLLRKSKCGFQTHHVFRYRHTGREGSRIYSRPCASCPGLPDLHLPRPSCFPPPSAHLAICPSSSLELESTEPHTSLPVLDLMGPRHGDPQPGVRKAPPWPA